MQRQTLYTVIDDQSICAATVTADGRLVIGNGSYRTIVLAYGEYISVEAAQKLAYFKNNGGTVVFVGTSYDAYKATVADGDERVSAAMAQLADCEQYALNVAGSRIAKLATRTLKLTSLDGVNSKRILYGEYFDASHDIGYFANSTEYDATATATFIDGYDGAYTIYYPYTGNIVSGSGNEIAFEIPAYCAVLIIREDKNEIDNTPAAPDTTEVQTAQPDQDTTDGESGDSTEQQEQKSGCKSALNALSVIAIAGAGAIALGKKKRK